ncbi:hypothetical protein V2J09_007107 [Rumex salicifolius]
MDSSDVSAGLLLALVSTTTNPNNKERSSTKMTSSITSPKLINFDGRFLPLLSLAPYTNKNDRKSGICMKRTMSFDKEEEEESPRKKLRLNKHQSHVLEDSFKHHSTLNLSQKQALAEELNLKPRQVEVWFQNRRARTKLKQTEMECEQLKRKCEKLREENKRLHKELHELKKNINFLGCLWIN